MATNKAATTVASTTTTMADASNNGNDSAGSGVLDSFLADAETLLLATAGPPPPSVAAAVETPKFVYIATTKDLGEFMVHATAAERVYVGIQGRRVLGGGGAMAMLDDVQIQCITMVIEPAAPTARSIHRGISSSSSILSVGYEDSEKECGMEVGVVYVVHVHDFSEYKDGRFKTLKGTDINSLGSIFQSPAVEKVFWDAGTQINALRVVFNWRVQNAVDLQLADWLGRVRQRHNRRGRRGTATLSDPTPIRNLVDCIGCAIPRSSIASFLSTKIAVESHIENGNLANGLKGNGSAKRYLTNQVRYLPGIHARTTRQLEDAAGDFMADWTQDVRDLTEARVEIVWARKDGWGKKVKDGGKEGQGYRGAKQVCWTVAGVDTATDGDETEESSAPTPTTTKTSDIDIEGLAGWKTVEPRTNYGRMAMRSDAEIIR